MITKVLIIDDSPVVRAGLEKAFRADPDLQVVGVAGDPLAALDLLDRLEPDVMTLDIEMPGMDGLTFLARMMKSRPMPIVLVTAAARKNPRMVMEAMRTGAFAVLPKPHADYPLPQMVEDLRQTLKEAHAKGAPRPAPVPAAIPQRRAITTVIAVGSSTGGTNAFETFARALPPEHPGVVLAQHLPQDFVPRFAERLGSVLQSRVAVARGGEPCEPGTIYIAPATHHLEVKREGAALVTSLSDAGPVNHHRPSCDVLLHSVAVACPRRAVGVILTGMGHDGAAGLLAMRRTGSLTFAQDEATSVVYGMPRAAMEIGAVVEQLPIDKLGRRVMELLAERAQDWSSVNASLAGAVRAR